MKTQQKRNFKILLDFSFHFMSQCQLFVNNLNTDTIGVSFRLSLVPHTGYQKIFSCRKTLEPTSPDCQLPNAATLTCIYWLILQHFVFSIFIVPTCCRLDFCRFLESSLCSSQIHNLILVTIQVAGNVSDGNNRQAHITLMARTICGIFPTYSFNFGPPTYFISHSCFDRTLHP